MPAPQGLARLSRRAFLIVTPGITIKDRLRVLLPSEPDNYYETREIVPPEMLPRSGGEDRDHQLPRLPASRDAELCQGRAQLLLKGNGAGARRRTETDAEMLQRACGKLLNYDGVIVINDEAHHCYRHKVGGDDARTLNGRRQEGGRREQGGRAALDQRHRGAGPQAVEACARSTTCRPRPSSCAARAMRKARCFPGSCPISA